MSKIVSAVKHPGQAVKYACCMLKYPSLFKIEHNVYGLIPFDLGMLLYESVLACRSNSPFIVEAGAFEGLSTCYLSEAAKRTNRRVKSFEIFTGLTHSHPILDEAFHVGQFPADKWKYEYNVKRYGCSDVVDLTVGDATKNLLPVIYDKGFCLAFLDVDVYSVTKELLFQLYSVSNGGETIIIHDAHSIGIQKAVDEIIAYSYDLISKQRVLNDTTFILKIQEG